MRFSSAFGSPAVDRVLATCNLLLLLSSSLARAVAFQSVPSPNLDLADLGRVALAGNFDSISLYQYLGQSENSLNTNGSQSLLGRYPSGAFAQLESADANIQAMCPFQKPDGTLIGIIVVGNFTSLGGQAAQAAALYDPVADTVTPLAGLDGQMATVYCANDIGTVFFGGSFSGLDSTNAIAWTTGWTNLPFAGFNGPVSTIARLSNGNVIFGGSFTGLGNTTLPDVPDAQVVNVGSATITASVTSSNTDYNTPADIVCQTNSSVGPGTSWILPDNTPGYWQANFQFGFEPSKLRLYNSRVLGYETKTWSFIALPINGIMNFTYVDPSSGQLSTCTNECPLPQDNFTYQDFHFVNTVGMNAFQIQISDWYGNGGGLGGIELFQNDIYSFAIPEFNEPKCDDVSNGANATSVGPWSVQPSGASTSGYLSTYLASGTDSSPPTVSVVFQPDIKQSGNYTITVYTPGCVQDNTCDTRGLVQITGQMGSATGSTAQTFSTTLYQTNYNDKYDQVFFGYVEANSDSFRPTVTLTPAPNQQVPLTVVAQRVGFNLSASTGGLHALFEYNPKQATISTDFSTSAINTAGNDLESGAQVNTLDVYNDVVFVGGSFSTETVENFMTIDNGAIKALPGNGLNASVQATYLTGSTIYVGGNFSNTKDGSETNLNNVAAYSINDSAWHALGAGVNGIVWSIVPLSVNVSATETAECIAISGYFDMVLGFANYSSFAVEGVALWVPSSNNWLHNIDSPEIALSGSLNAWTAVPGLTNLYSGALDSQDLGISGVATLTTAGSLQIQQLPIRISPNSEMANMKRAISSNETAEGVVTGLFYTSNGLNITVLGGHFTAQATNGSLIYNLAFINDSNSHHVTGLSSNSGSDAAIMALDTVGTTLFAGGTVANGLILYDLAAGGVSSTQPPALSGQAATVNAIATQPNAQDVFVGGSFATAGSLPCPALCVFNNDKKQWTSPASGLSADSTVYTLTWASPTHLLISGELTLNGQSTSLVTYDATARSFTSFSDADNTNSVPGPISALTPTASDYSSFWAAGTASNTSAFISKFDGKTWTPISHLLEKNSKVFGLQIFSLSTPDASNALLDTSQVLLVTGALVIPQLGNVSAALFNGTGFTPFILATTDDGSAGSIQRVFVQNPQNFLLTSHKYLALGFVVLIALAIALALIFLLVILGILAERLRRHREGYVPAPTRYVPSDKSWDDEKKEGLRSGYGVRKSVPPEQLFAGVGVDKEDKSGLGSRPDTRESVSSGR